MASTGPQQKLVTRSPVPAPPSGWSGLVPYSRWKSCCTWTLGLLPAADERRMLGNNQSCPQLHPEKNKLIRHGNRWHICFGKAAQNISGLQPQCFHKWIKVFKKTGFTLYNICCQVQNTHAGKASGANVFILTVKPFLCLKTNPADVCVCLQAAENDSTWWVSSWSGGSRLPLCRHVLALLSP